MENVILQKIEEYSELLDRKAELKDKTTENNKTIEKVRDSLADMMIDAETPQLTHMGYSFSVQDKVKWNKKAGMDDELFDVLRDNGLGDLIKETVNASSLTSALNNLVDENDDELPEDFEDVVSKYEYMDISRRKSNK